MPRLAANISVLYPERDFVDRFPAAAQSGFKGVECLFPYDFAPEILKRILAANDLKMVLMNLPAGDIAAGERGIACLPGRQDEFRESVKLAIDYAQALGCERVNCLAGIRPAGLDPDHAADILLDNLRYAANAFCRADIRLLIEPINDRDVPGFMITRTAQAIDLIHRLGHPNLAVQFDVYHRQIMEGDVAFGFARHQGHIGHIQIADTPGRKEPGSGEINFPFLLGWFDRLAYDGWVGCEYLPQGDTQYGLAWARAWLGNGFRGQGTGIGRA